VHEIALTQARLDDPGRASVERRVTAGVNTATALR
jgi:hypothetical protein